MNRSTTTLVVILLVVLVSGLVAAIRPPSSPRQMQPGPALSERMIRTLGK